MKKFSIVGIVMLTCASAYAAASSLAVPWYNDNLDPAKSNIYPATKAGIGALVILKSNSTDKLLCHIQYYNSTGSLLGPFGADNTFEINANSSLSFRPVFTDTNQESAEAQKVPNRPRSVDTNTVIPGTTVIDTKFNGAISVSWEGPSYYVQGIVTNYNTQYLGTAAISYSYGTLLPPGV